MEGYIRKIEDLINQIKFLNKKEEEVFKDLKKVLLETKKHHEELSHLLDIRDKVLTSRLKEIEELLEENKILKENVLSDENDENNLKSIIDIIKE